DRRPHGRNYPGASGGAIRDRLDLDQHVRPVEADVGEQRPRPRAVVDIGAVLGPEGPARLPDRRPVRAVRDVVVDDRDVLRLRARLADALDDLLEAGPSLGLDALVDGALGRSAVPL